MSQYLSVGKDPCISTRFNRYVVSTSGSTPLLTALSAGNKAAASALLKHGADPYILGSDRLSVVHAAGTGGLLELLEQLQLPATFIQLQTVAGNTPLHAACSSNQLHSIDWLLRKGANPNRVNRKYNTPLHIAAASGHSSAVAMLVQAGANPRAIGEHGQTAMHMVSKKGSAGDVIGVLKGLQQKQQIEEAASGASQQAVAQKGLALAVARATNADTACALHLLSVRDDYGCTPLQVAVEAHNIAAAGAIIDAALSCRPVVSQSGGRAPDPRPTDAWTTATDTNGGSDGGDPLTVLGMIGAAPTGPAAIISAAAQQSTAKLTSTDFPLVRPGLDRLLHTLCQSSAASAVRDMLRQGADPFTVCEQGTSPLQKALSLGHGSVADAVVDCMVAGAKTDADKRDRLKQHIESSIESEGGGRELLAVAIAHMSTSLVRYLRQLGVGLEPPDCKVVLPASKMRSKKILRKSRKGVVPASAGETRKKRPLAAYDGSLAAGLGERTHFCTVCSKRFRDAARLNKHMALVHKGAPQYGGGKLPSTSKPGPAIVRPLRKGMGIQSRVLGGPESVHRSQRAAKPLRIDRSGCGTEAPETVVGRKLDASPISSDESADPNPFSQKSADTQPSHGPHESPSYKEPVPATCELDMKVLAPAPSHDHEAWNNLLPALSVVQNRSVRTKGPLQTASDLDRLSSWEAQPPTDANGSSNTVRVEDGWVDKQLAGMLGTGIRQSAFIHAIGGSSLAVLKALLESTCASASVDWVQVLLARPGKEIGRGCCHSIARTTPLDFAVQIGRAEAVRVLLDSIVGNGAGSQAAKPQGGSQISIVTGIDNSDKVGPSSGAGTGGGQSSCGSAVAGLDALESERRDRLRWSAWKCLAQQNRSECSLVFLQFLGDEIKELKGGSDGGVPALAAAVCGGQNATVRALLDAGGVSAIRAAREGLYGGFNLLQLAARCKQWETLVYLVEKLEAVDMLSVPMTGLGPYDRAPPTQFVTEFDSVPIDAKAPRPTPGKTKRKARSKRAAASKSKLAPVEHLSHQEREMVAMKTTPLGIALITLESRAKQVPSELIWLAKKMPVVGPQLVHFTIEGLYRSLKSLYTRHTRSKVRGLASWANLLAVLLGKGTGLHPFYDDGVDYYYPAHLAEVLWRINGRGVGSALYPVLDSYGEVAFVPEAFMGTSVSALRAAGASVDEVLDETNKLKNVKVKEEEEVKEEKEEERESERERERDGKLDEAKGSASARDRGTGPPATVVARLQDPLPALYAMCGPSKSGKLRFGYRVAAFAERELVRLRVRAMVRFAAAARSV